ncbi:MAG: GTP-binding signal recognition particle [Parcubacteria group bacterium LiPW_39]|nr:MAG: GTP-binding signal recognition particle [Parcubacteria group bacterium LiPW_39]
MDDNEKVLYPELSYKIVGVLFEIWNEIGYSHKEKYIQSAIAKSLKCENLQFVEQLKANLFFKGEKIGLYFFDFLIENKIILEIKRREYFSKHDINQIYAYLKTSGLKLGIIACFTSKGVKFKRILNLY